MPALAPVILVAVLSFAAFATDSYLPPSVDTTSQLAQSGRAGDIDPKTYTPPVGGDIKIDIDPNYANLQCPKEEKLLRYRSDLPYKATFTINKVTYTNMYGKPCEGKAIQASCSGPQNCDGNMKGSRCLINNRWEDHCELPEQKIKVANLQSNTNPNVVCEGCTTGAEVPKVEAAQDAAGSRNTINPAAPKQTTEGISNAYRSAQGPVERGAIPREYSSRAGLDEIARTQPATDVPKSGTTFANSGNVRLNHDLGKVAMAPAAPAPIQPGQVQTAPVSTAVTNSNPFRPLPTAQTTFPKSPLPTTGTGRGPLPITQATSRSGRIGSAFTSFFNSSFSAQGIFSAITSVMSGITSATHSQSTPRQPAPSAPQPVPQPVIHQTIAVAPQRPSSTPSSPQMTIVPSEPQEFVPALTSSSTEYRLSGGTFRPARERGIPVDIALPIPDSEPTPLDEAPPKSVLATFERAPGTAPDIVATPAIPAAALPAPALFVAEASSSKETARGVFLDKVRTLSSATGTGTFKAASTTVRTTSIVQIFHAISIPDLLDAITQGSMDLINRVIARGTPENPVITTSYVEQSGAPVRTPEPPLLPALGSSEQARPSGEAVAHARAGVVARNSREFTEILRDDSTWVFRESSPAHQATERIALSHPRVFPDVIPVPLNDEANAASQPAAAEIVERIALRIRSLVALTFSWVNAGAR